VGAGRPPPHPHPHTPNPQSPIPNFLLLIVYLKNNFI